MTLANEIQQVSGAQFASKAHTRCGVCSPRGQSPFCPRFNPVGPAPPLRYPPAAVSAPRRLRRHLRCHPHPSLASLDVRRCGCFCHSLCHRPPLTWRPRPGRGVVAPSPSVRASGPGPGPPPPGRSGLRPRSRSHTWTRPPTSRCRGPAPHREAGSASLRSGGRLAEVLF